MPATTRRQSGKLPPPVYPGLSTREDHEDDFMDGELSEVPSIEAGSKQFEIEEDFEEEQEEEEDYGSDYSISSGIFLFLIYSRPSKTLPVGRASESITSPLKQPPAFV